MFWQIVLTTLFACSILVKMLLHKDIALSLSFASSLGSKKEVIPVGIYMFKVNNRNTRISCEICSKLTIKIPARRQKIFLIENECKTPFHTLF